MTYYIVSRLIGLLIAGCIIGYHVHRGDWKQQGDPYKLLFLLLPIMSLLPTAQEALLLFAVIFASSYAGAHFILWLNDKIEGLSEKRKEKQC